MKTLEFKTTIAAPVSLVWETMLGPDTYRQWTSTFEEGSYYEGTWEEGSKIYFLNPTGNGMVAKVAENKLHELISILMLGFVAQGIEDTESEDAKAWAPAFENYYFKSTDEGTDLRVTIEVLPEHEDMMTQPWLSALELLKSMCEGH
ncbi:SRPBCC domain-containing protein [Acidaminobacter sp.]|uniref:SRPBCC domain-containing protein n=1 Tax=Acidaminobacter sp. TaxID=1872102 RepID=UPI00256C1A53|nr:SRPBCC domain-containing protein [Acidaminobacter sp.]MDK9711162.1 hypothetical protein [Acidaminobacter sp.]